ncbi:MAG: hypothetical protein AAF560_25710 [Acidobacteriota bacterium]
MQSQEQVLWYTEDLLAAPPGETQATSSEDGAGTAQFVAMRMTFAVEGFGGFTAQSVQAPGARMFDTLRGDTSGYFPAGRPVHLQAKGSRNHQFSHWLFSNGDSETYGEGATKSIYPAIGLQIKAVFEEISE